MLISNYNRIVYNAFMGFLKIIFKLRMIQYGRNILKK